MTDDKDFDLMLEIMQKLTAQELILLIQKRGKRPLGFPSLSLTDPQGTPCIYYKCPDCGGSFVYRGHGCPVVCPHCKQPWIGDCG